MGQASQSQGRSVRGGEKWLKADILKGEPLAAGIGLDVKETLVVCVTG